MRSALARFLGRRIGHANPSSGIDIFLAFPLALPVENDEHRDPPHSSIERAFYEGSVMIW